MTDTELLIALRAAQAGGTLPPAAVAELRPLLKKAFDAGRERERAAGALRPLLKKAFDAGQTFARSPASFSAPGPPPRPGLVWKESTHRWANPHSGEEHEHSGARVAGDVSAQPASQQQPAEHEPAAREAARAIAADLTAGMPELRADPTLRATVADLALTAAARAYKVALDVTHSKWTHRLAELLGAYFDTPADLAKFGYNPTNTAQTARPVHDPVRDALVAELGVGLSGHLMAKIASAVVVKALYFLNAKLAGAPARMSTEGDWVTGIAGLLADLFDTINESVGLPPVNRAAVLGAVQRLAEGRTT